MSEEQDTSVGRRAAAWRWPPPGGDRTTCLPKCTSPVTVTTADA